MIPILILTIDDDNDRAFMIKLYTDYYGLMRKHAYQILQDNSVVDDMVQDTCVKLIEKISFIRSLHCHVLPSYIVITIRRVCLNYITHKKTMNKKEISGIQEDYIDEMADETINIEESVLRQLDIEHLQEAIQQLPQNYQDVLNFKYLLGMNDKEIAQVLGIKEGSVRQSVARAKQKALSMLSQMEDEAQNYGM